MPNYGLKNSDTIINILLHHFGSFSLLCHHLSAVIVTDLDAPHSDKAIIVSTSLSWWVSQIAKFMGPTWGPPGSCRLQAGPMLAPWNLLSGLLPLFHWYIPEIKPMLTNNQVVKGEAMLLWISSSGVIIWNQVSVTLTLNEVPNQILQWHFRYLFVKVQLFITKFCYAATLIFPWYMLNVTRDGMIDLTRCKQKILVKQSLAWQPFFCSGSTLSHI